MCAYVLYVFDCKRCEARLKRPFVRGIRFATLRASRPAHDADR